MSKRKTDNIVLLLSLFWVAFLILVGKTILRPPAPILLVVAFLLFWLYFAAALANYSAATIFDDSADRGAVLRKSIIWPYTIPKDLLSCCKD